MRKLIDIAKWSVTLGRGPQTFLGATWIRTVLKLAPESKKRIWALRMLSLSPHYFIDPENPSYAGMSNDEYLEAVCRDLTVSREKIFEYILKERLAPDDVVLDYGCGPGFLAATVSKHVRKIYACDISTGALDCARIINNSTNLEYLTADDKGLKVIPDKKIDVVFSFAMVQHISDEVFDLVLKYMRQKLKPGGRLVLHIQLLDAAWKTEREWKADRSIIGRVKYRVGLHCFARPEQSFRQILERNGFAGVKIQNIADIVPENFDDICSQSLLTAVKAG